MEVKMHLDALVTMRTENTALRMENIKLRTENESLREAWKYWYDEAIKEQIGKQAMDIEVRELRAELGRLQIVAKIHKLYAES